MIKKMGDNVTVVTGRPFKFHCVSVVMKTQSMTQAKLGQELTMY